MLTPDDTLGRNVDSLTEGVVLDHGAHNAKIHAILKSSEVCARPQTVMSDEITIYEVPGDTGDININANKGTNYSGGHGEEVLSTFVTLTP